jgi:hypothetical protein
LHNTNKCTEAIKMVSSSLSEHDAPRPWMKCFSSADFDMLMVCWDGSVLLSVPITVTVIVLVFDEDRGKDKYMNKSNLIDTFLQMGQTRVDLYWPWGFKTWQNLNHIKGKYDIIS